MLISTVFISNGGAMSNEVYSIIDLIFKFMIIPGVAALFRMGSSINQLKLELNRDFVSWKSLEERLNLERKIPKEEHS